MNFEEYIKPELLIMIPVLYIIGLGIKKSAVPDKHIPLILGVCSILMAAMWVIATSDISSLQDVSNAIFVSFSQGILAAGASVYINQLYIQSKKDK